MCFHFISLVMNFIKLISAYYLLLDKVSIVNTYHMKP